MGNISFHCYSASTVSSYLKFHRSTLFLAFLELVLKRLDCGFRFLEIFLLCDDFGLLLDQVLFFLENKLLVLFVQGGELRLGY